MNAHDAINNPPQGDSKLTVLDFADGQAKAHGAGYQAGYADAVKAIEVGKPAAAQEAVAWSKTKPTAEGAYYVRGFNLFQLAQYEALVQVRTHHFDGEPAPELVCNIHESTSNEDMGDWSPMVDMSDDFEWFGPLYAAPVAAAPVDLHAHLLHMLGAKDHEDAGRIIGELHAASMSTPAAPGIDLSERIAEVLRGEFDMETSDPEDHRYDDGHAEALRIAGKIIALIDASPKGGSDDVKLKAAETAGHDCAIRYVLGYLNGTGDCGGTMYEEIINGCGRERIIQSAIENGELEFTGLADFIKTDGTAAEKRKVRAALRLQATSAEVGS